MTQLDAIGRERVIELSSKRLSRSVEDYPANDRKILGLIRFLEGLRCYPEGSAFEIITDNKILNNFLTKPKVSRKEARWIVTIGNLGILQITLKTGTMKVIGNVLSKALHAREVANVKEIEVNFIRFEDIITEHDKDEFFGLVVKDIYGKFPNNPKKKLKFESIVIMFEWS